MAKEYDIEDEKFEALLADKRHKELTKELGKLVTAMTSKDDAAMMKFISEQPAIFKASMEQVIKSLPKPETPNVEVNIDYENLVSSFENISDAAATRIENSNNSLKEAIENRLLPDTFTLVKSYGGATESVKVNYKPANQIKK